MPLSLIPGDIIKAWLPTAKPPKEKFLVIMTIENDIYRVFCINTEIDDFLSSEKAFRDAQIEVTHQDYPFLPNEKSYISCWQLEMVYLHEVESDFTNHHNDCGFKGHLLPPHKSFIRLIVSDDDSNISQYDAKKIISGIDQSYSLLRNRSTED